MEAMMISLLEREAILEQANKWDGGTYYGFTMMDGRVLK